ncbi:MAG: Hsp20/alpha crystallin family protein, partial [Isosphaeraceae bacterium]
KADEEKKGTHWHLRERRVNSLVRSLSLRAPVNTDAAIAHFDHGVLTLTLPKTAEAKPKQIAVVSAPTPPPSSDRPDRPAPERETSGTGKSSPADRSAKPGGKPEPTHDVAAEQIREAKESREARDAVASNRNRMEIGRGN